MSVMGGSVEALSTKTGNEPAETTMPAKTNVKGYRQKLMTIKATSKYREHTLKGFKKHLTNSKFPQRMKSIKPYPKMSSPEAQAIVNAACDQVQSVILDQMIQEEEKKLSQDHESYQTMRMQRESDRQQLKAPKKPNCGTYCGSTPARARRLAVKIYPTL